MGGRLVVAVVALAGLAVGCGPEDGGDQVQLAPVVTTATTVEQSTTTVTAPTTTTTTTVATTSTSTTQKQATTTTAARVAAAPAAPACHPSYADVCLPPDAEDVDCPGGSGNGPVYAPREDFRVVGPDEYDLDRDGDGIACESR